MKTIFIILIVSNLLSIRAYTQNYSVRGFVTNNHKLLLNKASVSLLKQKDSSSSFMITDTNGRFHFNDLYSGAYTLKISFIGLPSVKKNILIKQESIDLGRMILFNLPSKLDEVVVTSKVLSVTQKGDTTQFNAMSFKTNPDANAEDLIKKMPGIEINGGKVKAHGEVVTKILVDGKPFFGNDPNTALKNLPAEMIDKIQVYDAKNDQSQFTGVDDGQTSKTINMVTKGNMRNGKFGKLFAGYGNDDRYQDGLNLHSLNGDQRLSLIALSNNTNIQNSQDNGSVNTQSNLTGQNKGISNLQTGLNYTDNWGKKTNITGSYLFNISNLQSNNFTFRNYIVPSDSGLSYQQNKQSSNQNYTHKLNLRIDFKIDSLNSILVTPGFNIQQSNSLSVFTGQTDNINGPLNKIANNNVTNTQAYNFSTDALYRHRFEKSRRTFSFNLNTNYNYNDGSSKILSKDLLMDSNTINQNSDLLNKGWSISGNTSYTEPIGKRDAVQLNYTFSVQQNQSEKSTYNFSDQTNQYNLLDTTLTNSFRNQNITHKFGTTYHLQTTKVNLSLGANYQWLRMQNNPLLPELRESTRTYNNILPNAVLRYKISAQKNLNIFYTSITNQPSVNQLQNVVNNTNPIQLSTGNPDLKQAFQQNLRVNYTAINKINSHTLFLTLSGTYTNNFISNSTSFVNQDVILNGNLLLKRGGQLSMPVNLDGYFNITSSVTYSLPFNKIIKSNLNLTLSHNYGHNPGLINGQLNYSNIQTVTIGAVLSSNISQKIDFILSTNSIYNYTINTIQSNLNSKYFNQNSDVSLNWMFWKKFVLVTQLNEQNYYGLSNGYNQNYLLWNMSIAKKLLKSDQFEIKLSVFDVLNQNRSIHRNYTMTYYEDVRTQVLQRYFMFTLTYTIRNFKQIMK